MKNDDESKWTTGSRGSSSMPGPPSGYISGLCLLSRWSCILHRKMSLTVTGCPQMHQSQHRELSLSSGIEFQGRTLSGPACVTCQPLGQSLHRRKRHYKCLVQIIWQALTGNRRGGSQRLTALFSKERRRFPKEEDRKMFWETKNINQEPSQLTTRFHTTLRHNDGGLVAKLCPTFAIPWTVAC